MNWRLCKLICLDKSIQTLDKRWILYKKKKKNHLLVRADGLDFTMTTDVYNREQLFNLFQRINFINQKALLENQ